MIEIKNLSYRYSEDAPRPAIDNLSLNIDKGEFVVILGHNGSGKSTLAKCLNALYTPTEGEIIVDGFNTRDEEHLWDIRRRAGMVFQNPDNQIVATMVEEDVAFGPENLAVEPEEIRRRVDYALDVVDMQEFRRKSPHQLSGGQKQRVAIAGILAMNPDYIILDEPTAMLDPVGREEVVATVKRLNREQGKTVILITHFMSEAVEADRLVVMEKGRIILEGAPREVFQNVQAMKDIGLDVPQVTEVSQILKEAGFPLEGDILHREEFVEAVCRALKSKN
ncbi:MAG: energy-coupling factor transporter ATPase [Tissierellia bacterium]|nr:energy-coupling factor transporter ATPase [Tissierellia bacterium]